MIINVDIPNSGGCEHIGCHKIPLPFENFLTNKVFDIICTDVGCFVAKFFAVSKFRILKYT